METVAETHFIVKENKPTGRKQASYWEIAFELAGIAQDHDTGLNGKCHFDIDTFIVSLEKQFLNESGSVKYLIILSLFKLVASLSHGNAAPENGFSINKHLIGIHWTSI